ncbi:MAG: polysaccharide pyruvyl transferase family protein, partial [Lachnospiraceae bacterium]|nr:polysaccharide pyruvyl transferase family protein [Lachnospiraceae bacterium]
MHSNKRTIILYMHAGSGNHGCEAIANALGDILGGKNVLISYRADEDAGYSLKDMYDIRQEKSFDRHKVMHLLYYAYRTLTGDTQSFVRYRFGEFLSKKNLKALNAKTGVNAKYPLAISIGGDNYCYDVMLNDLSLTNAAFNAQGTKTVLLGCSIEPDSFNNKDLVKDLSCYHTIIARESITYEALKKCFESATAESLIEKLPEIVLVPDPAFALKPKKPLNVRELIVGKDLSALLDEAGEFTPGTVGINISPMIQDNETLSGITIKNYERLIEYIIEETDLNVILIPHVVWDNNDDRKPIETLLIKYIETGRVFKVEDCECGELKYIISKCRFFIGARTHSTIAAYSSCVPTLVVGYSVKARGIAKDLFETDDTSRYVIPVQGLKEEDELQKEFVRMFEH